VKEALHANPLIKWKDCTNRVDYSMKSQNHYMEPIYRFLLAEDRNLRVLLYSGDDDSVCGPRGTELWLRTMGWKIEEPWHPYQVDGEVAGFLRRYDNGLIFATVHGAGHEVPAFAPEAALHLFKAFIDDDREKL
jgi:carboxypeptidase C (cathepsin A)